MDTVIESQAQRDMVEGSWEVRRVCVGVVS